MKCYDKGLRTFFPLKALLSVIFTLLLCSSAFALTPLKGLLLGNLEGNSISKDPLPFLMTEGDSSFSKSSKGSRFKSQLARYRGFYEEGENLEKSCRVLGKVHYANSFDREQAKRAVISSLQYYALDHLVSAIAKNASDRKVTNIAYNTYVDYMIGSYCSSNMTIISHRELKRQFSSRFERIQNGQYEWTHPDVTQNPLFAQALSETANMDMVRDREFYVWSELFKSVCSWSGDIFNNRLMVPLIRDPVIMSYVFRTMSKLDLNLNEKKNEITLSKSDKLERVVCKNLICRRSKSDKEFLETFPKSIGSSGLLTDLERLYCQDLRDVDYVRKGQVPEIKAIMDKRTLDEEALLKSGLIALWTGIPDLMLYGEKFSDIQKIVDHSFKREVSRWSDEQIAYGLTDLTYEEPIAYEIQARGGYWNITDKILKVQIDVNLGEFDRMNQSIGKLSVDVPLGISESFLSWLQYEWKGSVGLASEIRDSLVKRLSVELDAQMQKNAAVLKLELWPPQITELISQEVVGQLGLMQHSPFKRESRAKIDIPVRLHFGIFALKALRDKFLIEKSIREGDLLKEELALSLADSKKKEKVVKVVDEEM